MFLLEAESTSMPVAMSAAVVHGWASWNFCLGMASVVHFLVVIDTSSVMECLPVHFELTPAPTPRSAIATAGLDTKR